MAARKLRGSWWVDFRYEGRRYRKKSPENSKKGAMVHESRLRQKLMRGEPLREDENAKKRFRDFSRAWFKTHQANIKPSTSRSIGMIMEQHLTPYFGKKHLEDIDTASIEHFKALKRERGLSPKTINNYLSVLRSCLNAAMEWGLIEKLPKVSWMKVPLQKFRFLTSEDSGKLLEASKNTDIYGMMLCALRTGMRFGELLGLKWEDIDGRTLQINVRRSIVRGIEASPKNNRERHIPMSEDLARFLISLPRKGEYVFGVPDGRPRTRGSADRLLRSAYRRAGLEVGGWHVLRHTFASQLVMEGVSPRAVQELLGHSTLQMTMRYAHLSPSSLRDAVMRLQTAEERVSLKSGHYLGTKQEIDARTPIETEARIQQLLR